MNVLGINGSPRGKDSHTDHILQPFLEGAREAGASAETIYLKEHEIKPCTGCFTCWLVTPGKCIFKDDMPGILEKILETDVMVFSTPLYNCSMSALMKAFHERQIPLAEPYVIINEQGEMAHPLRQPEKGHQKWVLISNAGLPETKHFDVLLENYERLVTLHGGGGYAELVGTILKGMGGAFSKAPADPGSLEWFFDACRQAGREVVKEGRISAGTQEILDRPLFDLTPEAYVETLNSFLESGPANDATGVNHWGQVVTINFAARISDPKVDSYDLTPFWSGRLGQGQPVPFLPYTYGTWIRIGILHGRDGEIPLQHAGGAFCKAEVGRVTEAVPVRIGNTSHVLIAATPVHGRKAVLHIRNPVRIPVIFVRNPLGKGEQIPVGKPVQVPVIRGDVRKTNPERNVASEPGEVVPLLLVDVFDLLRFPVEIEGPVERALRRVVEDLQSRDDGQGFRLEGQFVACNPSHILSQKPDEAPKVLGVVDVDALDPQSGLHSNFNPAPADHSPGLVHPDVRVEPNPLAVTQVERVRDAVRVRVLRFGGSVGGEQIVVCSIDDPILILVHAAYIVAVLTKKTILRHRT